jgi:hypothetical protein
MPLAREWTAEERAIVLGGRASGLSAAAIARQLGTRSKQSVLRFCRSEGVAKAAVPSRRARKTGAAVWPAGTRFEDSPAAVRDKGSPGPIPIERRWI